MDSGGEQKVTLDLRKCKWHMLYVQCFLKGVGLDVLDFFWLRMCAAGCTHCFCSFLSIDCLWDLHVLVCILHRGGVWDLHYMSRLIHMPYIGKAKLARIYFQKMIACSWLTCNAGSIVSWFLNAVKRNGGQIFWLVQLTLFTVKKTEAYWIKQV